MKNNKKNCRKKIIKNHINCLPLFAPKNEKAIKSYKIGIKKIYIPQTYSK